MMRFVVTPLPDNSHLVRVCDGDGPDYARMIVVTVTGDCLFLSGWIGKTLTVSEWRKAAADLFPQARRVRFERRKGDGVRHVELML